MKVLKLLVILALTAGYIFPQQIILHIKNADAWGTGQVIKGNLKSFYTTEGTLYVNELPISFNISQSDSSFLVPVTLGEDLNTIIVKADNNGTAVSSDTLRLTLKYKLKPSVFAWAEVSGTNVTLKSTVTENPQNEQMFFQWSSDSKNPASLTINSEGDSIAAVSFPTGAPGGEYYFNLLVTTFGGDTTNARTYVTVSQNSIIPFDIKRDHAAWIDSAVIYEITPYIFVTRGKFSNITAKISEIVRLGVNTIWIQPIYRTRNGGQGYDITDYFRVRSDYGTEDDLRTLIKTAKSYGLKVLFDFVPNHSSKYHPYAINSAQYGTDSHYWDFYQRTIDNGPYSDSYHDSLGNVVGNNYHGLINYFWTELPNLNFNNTEVRKWIIEAVKYWVEKFDIDGYRFDAVWGTTARNPQFTKDLRIALKTIKPEILLLAEDKASQDQVFDERFDVAFDWTPEEDWVSHWSWQTSYSDNSNPTIFNYSSQSQRSSLLRKALNNNGNGYASNAKILRFLSNNDKFYFITHHQVERTKMAAALQFTLNGVPLVYNGDEIGKSGHPYDTEYIFYPGYPLDHDDNYGLFHYYQNLIKYKKTMPALYGNNYAEITMSPSSYIFGFRRWQNDQNIYTILNMGSSATSVTASLKADQLNLDSTKIYYLTDLLSGEFISGKLSEMSTVSVSMNSFSARVYLLADSIMQVTGINDKLAENSTPGDFKLMQNYPNPFNPATTIIYTVPGTNGNNIPVQLKVYDILGNEIASLVNEEKPAGIYNVSFNASKRASGVYIYKLQAGGTVLSRKMILLK